MTKREIEYQIKYKEYIKTEIDKILYQGVIVREERRKEIRERIELLNISEEAKSLFEIEGIITNNILAIEEETWRESIDDCEGRRNKAYQEIEVLEKTLKEERGKETSYHNFKILEAEYNMNLSKISEKIMTTKILWFVLGAIVTFLFK